MKKIFLISIFYIFFFCSNSFAFLEFKQSKDISSDTDHLRGITFNPDGSRMYVTADETNPTVIQYSLSSAFDISTATKISEDALVGEGGNFDKPHAIEFKPDGKVMYVIRSESDNVGVEQFNLSTAWDTSTISYATRKIINEAGDCSTNVQARALAFKPDGTRMFVSQEGAEVVSQYDLTTAWDVSSATNNVCSNSFGDQESDMRNIQFNSDGTIMYLGGSGSDDINKYKLPTAWDISTITHVTSYSISSQTVQMRGFKFTANFTKLYVTGDDGSDSDDNVVYEYSLACAGTITCDPINDKDIKATIEANVELSKRIIKNNTLPIFHRIEWLRRHKNKDNLSNLNAEINFTDKKISKLVSALKNSKKEIDRSYDSDDWFQWSEGRVSVGENKSLNSSSRDFHSYGISIGADRIKEDDRDAMYGYVFQYGSDNVDIGYKGSKLDTDAYSLALYGTKLRDNDVFTDALIGVSLLDIDQKRVTFGNTLKGNREGQQIFGSFNFGKRVVDEDINLNHGIKLDLGYTKLKAFSEKSTVANSLTDALLYKDQNIKSALVTLGILLDKTDTDKQEDEIINHHGRFEFIADLSPSSDAEFYYLNSQSTVYNYKVDNNPKGNFRIGYGFDVTSISGWSLVGNFERFQSAKSHSNEIYLSAGYVPIDEMKFVFDVNNFNTTSLSLTNKVNGFDITVGSNYTLMSEIPDYGANIEVSNKF
ncbi:autotransporter domain-containing protein [Candidatus Pelagibacter sp. Uisw_099_02]|uniref:autotransporter domain-containing protein n=1 Tax=Candidatus Pelagibacter sp. Uisw_099_02 TaxID=3230981 RepID=UPI002374AEE1|nr:autotransporter domain-containing protein [Candidatus Pelagibacter sp.]